MATLLIVDDEPLLVDSLQYLLLNICEHVYVAQNGEEAIAIMGIHKIDCVLSDYFMPVMSGMELLKKVRETKSEIPFIFYTGQGVEIITSDLKNYTGYEIVSKPSFDRIPEVIRTYLSK